MDNHQRISKRLYNVVSSFQVCFLVPQYSFHLFAFKVGRQTNFRSKHTEHKRRIDAVTNIDILSKAQRYGSFPFQVQRAYQAVERKENYTEKPKIKEPLQ